MTPRPGLSFLASGLICFGAFMSTWESNMWKQRITFSLAFFTQSDDNSTLFVTRLPARVNLGYPRAVFLKLWGWDPNWVTIQLGGGSRADKAENTQNKLGAHRFLWTSRCGRVPHTPKECFFGIPRWKSQRAPCCRELPMIRTKQASKGILLPVYSH